jgi:hypothetical protein
MFWLASSSRKERPGKFTLILIGLWLCASLGAVPPVSAQEVSASKVKAAFLYNFAKFVEWPPGTFAHDQAVITFCILDGGPLAEAVEALHGKEVQGRKIVVTRSLNVEEIKKCQIFFASASNKPGLTKIIGALRGFPVLTVTDEVDDFAGLGGIINLVRVEDKVRFEISVNNAEKSGLKISSQLTAVR